MREPFDRIYKDLADFYRLSFTFGFGNHLFMNEEYTMLMMDSIEWMNECN